MNLNTYGFDKHNTKSKVYVSPDNKDGWKDEYKLRKPYHFKFNVKGEHNGSFVQLYARLPINDANYTPSYINDIEVSGVNIINSVVHKYNMGQIAPYVKFNSEKHTLTFFNYDKQPLNYLDDKTLGNDTYWMLSQSDHDIQWPWNLHGEIVPDIYEVIFNDPICLGTFKELFSGMENLTEIHNIENLVSTGIKDMSYMFAGCESLKSLDLSYMDTSNVDTMMRMFLYCINLENLKISSFSFKNVLDARDMFEYCYKLKTNIILDIPYDTDMNMMYMFLDCATVGGSSAFIYFDENQEYSSEELEVIKQAFEVDYPNSNIIFPGTRKTIPPKSKTFSASLEQLNNMWCVDHGYLYLLTLPGDILSINNISKPFYITDHASYPIAAINPVSNINHPITYYTQNGYTIESARIKDSDYKLQIEYLGSTSFIGAYLANTEVDTLLIAQNLDIVLNVIPYNVPNSTC